MRVFCFALSSIVFPMQHLKLALCTRYGNQASMTFCPLPWIRPCHHCFVAFNATEKDVLSSPLAAVSVARSLVCFLVSVCPATCCFFVKCHLHNSWRSVSELSLKTNCMDDGSRVER